MDVRVPAKAHLAVISPSAAQGHAEPYHSFSPEVRDEPARQKHNQNRP